MVIENVKINDRGELSGWGGVEVNRVKIKREEVRQNRTEQNIMDIFSQPTNLP